MRNLLWVMLLFAVDTTVAFAQGGHMGARHRSRRLAPEMLSVLQGKADFAVARPDFSV